MNMNVILVNLACSHWASSLLIYLYAVPAEGGVALSGRVEDAAFFSIAAATGLGSVQFGLLAGVAFSASYVLLGATVSARAVLGVGEWFVNNASHTLLAEKCGAAEARGEANSVYVLGVYLGMGVASLSLAAATLVGWRSVCHVVALCFSREPRPRPGENVPIPSA